MNQTRLQVDDILWIARMTLVTLLAKLAETIVPRDAKKTVTWLKKRPFED